MRHTSLRQAIGSNDLASFERLLSSGAAPDDGAVPSLLEVAAAADQGRMVRRLLEVGADAKTSGFALNWAARHRDLLTLDALLAAGAPERLGNHEDGPGSKRGFPLACAARGGSLACAQRLSARLAPGDGHSEALTEVAMGVLDAHDRVDAERRVELAAIVRHLAQCGGDPTELAHAAVAHTSQAWLLEEALSLGARADGIVNSLGQTLLHVAAARLRAPMIPVLRARGADLEARDAYGATPRDLALAVTPSDVEEASRQRLCVGALGVRSQTAGTRAPEPARGALRPGARVAHGTHGRGTVLKVTGDTARVRFSAILSVDVPCAELRVM